MPGDLDSKSWGNRLLAAYWVASLLVLAFGYGVAVCRWRIFPYAILEVGFDAWRSTRIATHIGPAVHEGEGVTNHDPGRAFQGVTMLTGLWRDGDGWDLGIRVIDMSGATLHHWKVDPAAIWDRTPHEDLAAGSKFGKRRTYIHGARLLSGGDVVFNLEFLGLVRLDPAGKVVWKLDYRTHHSVFEDGRGFLWVCGQRWREEVPAEYLGLGPPLVEDMILKVSPDGRVVRKVSVLKALYESGRYAWLFADECIEDGKRLKGGDVTHMNHVEVLDPGRAPAFAEFGAGDLLVSLRNINAILVLDGRTEEVLWSMSYPFVGQHDPHFTADGRISVFDNGLPRREPGQAPAGSRILRIDPGSREVTVLYGEREGERFFTAGGGKQQLLPNGNRLITEARAGRVFEVAPDGDLVWSWQQARWKGASVTEVLQGRRYDSDDPAVAVLRQKTEA